MSALRLPTRGHALFAMLASGLFVLSGCVTDTSDGPVDVTFDTIDQGSYGEGPEESEDLVISDQDSWEAFWRLHSERTGGSPDDEPPAIDFFQSFIIFSYGGQKPTGGHSIHIVNMTFDDGYHLNVVDVRPTEGCGVTQALTHPYELVRVNRASGDEDKPDVAFDHGEVADCPGRSDGGGSTDPSGSGDTSRPADGEDQGGERTHETIDQGTYSQGPQDAEEHVISSEESWQSFWSNHQQRKGGMTNDPASPPPVDFNKEFVVYVYAGQKPTGGHTISVTDVRDGNDTYEVHVKEERPGDSCIVTQNVNHPYHIVRVPRGDVGGTPQVTFERSTVTNEC